jgi:hypothetical protein
MAKVTDVVITVVFGANARHVTAGVSGQTWRAQTLVPPPDLIREILCKTREAIENQASSIDLTVDQNGLIQRTESFILPDEGCPAPVSASSPAMSSLSIGGSHELARELGITLSEGADRHRSAIDLIRAIISRVPPDDRETKHPAAGAPAAVPPEDGAAAGKGAAGTGPAARTRAGKATARAGTPKKPGRKTKRAGKKTKD